MRGQKPIPPRSELVSFKYAVAGHAGTLADQDGELFIKPCTQHEIDFYTSAGRRHPEFADLMPTFYGSLYLDETADPQALENSLAAALSQSQSPFQSQSPSLPQPQSQSQPPPGKKAASGHLENGKWVPNHAGPIKTDLSVVLENGMAGFKKPNVLDTKLGARLWADSAPMEKKRVLDKVSASTTSTPLGFRVAGMRVYRGSEDERMLDEEGFRIYKKEYGRTVVNKDNILDPFYAFLCSPGSGIDRALSLAVAAGFLRDLRRVEDVLSRHESRMYSSSLLFIYEGDAAALEAAIDENNAIVEAADGMDQEEEEKADQRREEEANERREDEEEGTGTTERSARTESRVDSGISLSDIDVDSDDEAGLPKIFSLKLIDFAHARWAPGEGPDENVLHGVRSLITIFEKIVLDG